MRKTSKRLHGVELTRFYKHMQNQTFFLGVDIPTADGRSGEMLIGFAMRKQKRETTLMVLDRGIVGSDQQINEVVSWIGQYETDEVYGLTSEYGWHEGNVYVTDSLSIGPRDARRIIHEGQFSPGAVKQVARGSLKGWREKVAHPAQISSLAAFAICVALASVLLRLCKVEGAIFHISGWSSIGKTTVLKVAASVWRGGEAAVDSWDTSLSAFSDLLLERNDGLMCLDEVSVAASKKQNLRDILRMLSYGIAAVSSRRLSKHFKNRDAQRSLGVFALSTGESTAGEIAQAVGEVRAAGEEARFIDIAVRSRRRGVFDRIDKVAPTNFEDSEAAARYMNEAVEHQYGTAGPEFVRYIVNDVDEAKAAAEDYMDEFVARLHLISNRDRRIARKFALVYAAGCLGIKAGVLPWSEKVVRACVNKVYRMAVRPAKQDDSELRRLLQQIQRRLQDAVTVPEKKRPGRKRLEDGTLAAIDSAPVLRRKQRDGSRQILVESAEIKRLAGRNTRQRLLERLVADGVCVSTKREQITPATGAARRYFFVFTDALEGYRFKRSSADEC